MTAINSNTLSTADITSLEQRVKDNFEESVRALRSNVDILAPIITTAATRMLAALTSGHKILACGNGGSAADAQHFSAELLNRFEMERAPLAAIALTTDTSTLTSIANDYHFDQVFEKQVQALGCNGDVLFGITTSGNSPNILRAVKTAHMRGMTCIVLNGRDGGKLGPLLREDDVNICVNGSSTARIQEVHGIILHCLCDLIDYQLLGNNKVRKQ